MFYWTPGVTWGLILYAACLLLVSVPHAFYMSLFKGFPLKWNFWRPPQDKKCFDDQALWEVGNQVFLRANKISKWSLYQRSEYSNNSIDLWWFQPTNHLALLWLFVRYLNKVNSFNDTFLCFAVSPSCSAEVRIQTLEVQTIFAIHSNAYSVIQLFLLLRKVVRCFHVCESGMNKKNKKNEGSPVNVMLSMFLFNVVRNGPQGLDVTEQDKCCSQIQISPAHIQQSTVGKPFQHEPNNRQQ